MREILEGLDLCGVPLVAMALHVAASTAARHAPRYRDGMGYAAVLALLIVGAWGISTVGPFEARTVLAVGVLAWVSGSSAALAALLILPPGLALWNGWKAAITNHQNEVRRWKEKREEERVRASWLPLPPPSPEPEENPDADLEEAMRRDKENRERVERSPLTRTQKDELLRELDGLLQSRVRGTME